MLEIISRILPNIAFGDKIGPKDNRYVIRIDAGDVHFTARYESKKQSDFLGPIPDHRVNLAEALTEKNVYPLTLRDILSHPDLRGREKAIILSDSADVQLPVGNYWRIDDSYIERGRATLAFTTPNGKHDLPYMDKFRISDSLPFFTFAYLKLSGVGTKGYFSSGFGLGFGRFEGFGLFEKYIVPSTIQPSSQDQRSHKT